MPHHADAARRASGTKFGRYVQRLQTEPFIALLAAKVRVSEQDTMRAYGLTPRTRSWPSKVSSIATKARRELREYGITLGPAAQKKGWSLAAADRAKLRELIQGAALPGLPERFAVPAAMSQAAPMDAGRRPQA